MHVSVHEGKGEKAIKRELSHKSRYSIVKEEVKQYSEWNKDNDILRKCKQTELNHIGKKARGPLLQPDIFQFTIKGGIEPRDDSMGKKPNLLKIT